MDERTLERLDYLAELSDDAITIPGTRIRFGFDPIIGLIPGIGDAVGGLLSSYIIFEACRHRLPVSVILRMIMIALAELLIGAIPLFGDIFDLTWKANRRNINLIKRTLGDRRRVRRSSLLIVTAVFLLFVGILVAIFFLLWLLFDWLTAIMNI